MKLVAAPTHEQGQDFVIVLVKDRVINSPTDREEIITFAEQEFGMRAALLGEQRAQTYGPNDIVRWLGNVHPSQLPWREYSLAA